MERVGALEAGVLEKAAGLFRARRYLECAAVLDAVLAGGPHAGALHMRAECCVAGGELDAAAADFEAALLVAPFAAGVWAGRADLELWREGLAGWERVVDRALARPVLPPDGFHFLVRKACLMWMRREVAGCSAVLGHLSAELVRQGAGLASVLQGWSLSTAVHLRGLLAAEGGVRRGRYSAEALPPVFLLGDSHCIGPAGSVVAIGGRAHRVVPLYVLGCKAWHLAGAEAGAGANPYRACAERRAAEVPAGAVVMVSAGDIDCRVRSGFDNLRRRIGGDVRGAIGETVEGYVGWVRRMLGGAGRVMVLAHPVRRGELIADAGERAAVLAIDGQFRAALRAVCWREGVEVVDLAALTAEWFVDAHHLAGGALGAALEAGREAGRGACLPG